MEVQMIFKDKFRLAVIENLSHGEKSADQLTKQSHLPSSMMDKALRELEAEGMVGGPVTELHLTEKGHEALREFNKSERSVGSEVGSPSSSPQRLTGEANRKRKEDQGT
jgi:DNA-binding HxlR family transcriptional regulator